MKTIVSKKVISLLELVVSRYNLYVEENMAYLGAGIVLFTILFVVSIMVL